MGHRSEGVSDVARGSQGALAALAKVKKDRQALADREAELRVQAAGEIGAVVLEAGAEDMDPAKLGKLVKLAVQLGEDEALKRLERAA